MPLSPVIEAFLAGQGQQNDINSKAKDWQLKREQLDQALKEFDANHKIALQKVDLDNQHMELQNKIAHASARQRLMENIQSGAIPIPTQDQQVSIPGVDPSMFQSNPTQALTSVPGFSGTIQTPIPVGANMQATTDMGDQVNLPRPMTTAELNDIVSKRQKADKIEEFDQTTGKMNRENNESKAKMLEDKLNSQEQINQIKVDTQKAIHDAQIKMMERGQDTREAIAAMNERSKIDHEFAMMGLPTDPKAFDEATSTAASKMATGEVDKKELHPRIANAAENKMLSAGYIKPPKGFNDDVNGLANSAITSVNNIENFTKSLKPPTSIGGKVGNVLADKFGIGGLSPYKSQYDAFIATNLPSLDVAVGLTPGALSRSPKLMDKLKAMLPLPGDNANLVAQKSSNIMDLYLGGINKKMMAMPVDQRKLNWKNLVDKNPELLNNKGVADKVIKAIDTGMYSPGSISKSFLEEQ